MTNKFLPKLMGLESILGKLRKLLAIGSKRSYLGNPNTTEVLYESHTTSLGCSERLVEFLITGDSLYTSEHSSCVLRSSGDGLDIK